MIKIILISICICLNIFAEEKRNIKELIKDFSSDEYAHRESAQNEILERWQEWSTDDLNVLLDASKNSNDPEVSFRSRNCYYEIKYTKFCHKYLGGFVEISNNSLLDILMKLSINTEFFVTKSEYKDFLDVFNNYLDYNRVEDDNWERAILSTIMIFPDEVCEDFVAKFLQSKSDYVRRLAGQHLIKLESTRYIKEIINYFKMFSSYETMKIRNISFARLLLQNLKSEDINFKYSLINHLDRSLRIKLKTEISELFLDNDSFLNKAYFSLLTRDKNDIDTLRYLLDNFDNLPEEIKKQVIYEIDEKNLPPFKSYLVKFLSSESPDVVYSVISQLGSLKCVDELGNFLDKTSAHIKERVIEELIYLNDSKYIGKIEEEIKNVSNECKLNCIDIIANNLSKNFIPILFSFMKDNDMSIRADAFNGILNFKDFRIFKEAVNLLSDWEMLPRLDFLMDTSEYDFERNIIEIEQLLDSKNIYAQKVAMDILSELQLGKYVDRFAKFLDSNNDVLVSTAIEYLTKMDSKEYLVDLERFLKSNSIDVVAETLEAVRKYKLKQYEDDVRRLLDSQDEYIVSRAVLTLASFNDKRYVDRIHKMTDSESYAIRSSAFCALAYLDFDLFENIFQKKINNVSYYYNIKDYLEEVKSDNIFRFARLLLMIDKPEVDDFLFTQLNYYLSKRPLIPDILNSLKTITSSSQLRRILRILRLLNKQDLDSICDTLLNLLDSPDEDIRFETFKTVIESSVAIEKEKIVSVLNSFSNRLKASAIEILTSQNRNEFIPDVVKLLNDSSNDVKIAVINYLERFYLYEYLEQVEKLLNDSNPEVVYVAFRFIKRFQPEILFKYIRKLLKSDKVHILNEVINLIAEYELFEYVEDILLLMEDELAYCHNYYYSYYRDYYPMLDDSLHNLFRKFFPHQHIVRLINIHRNGYFYISDLLYRSQEYLKAQNAKINDPDLLNLILTLLKNEDEELRRLGFALIDNVDFSFFKDRVKDFLSDELNEVKILGLRTAKFLKQKEFVPQILDIINNSNLENIVKEAIETIISIDPELSKSAIKVSVQKFPDSVYYIIDYIRSHKVYYLSDVIAGYLKNDVPDIRQEAIEALRDLNEKKYYDEILNLLYDDAEDVRFSVLEALWELNPKDSFQKILNSAINNEDYELLDTLLGCSERRQLIDNDDLLRLLQTKNTNIKRLALWVVTTISKENVSDELLKKVKELLNDENDQVRYYAISFLANINATDCVDEIAKFLDDSEIAIEALGELDAFKYVDRIASFLKSDNIDLRNSAIEALSDLHITEYIPQILDFLYDKKSKPYVISAITKFRLREHLKEISNSIYGPLYYCSDYIKQRTLIAIASFNAKEFSDAVFRNFFGEENCICLNYISYVTTSLNDESILPKLVALTKSKKGRIRYFSLLTLYRMRPYEAENYIKLFESDKDDKIKNLVKQIKNEFKTKIEPISQDSVVKYDSINFPQDKKAQKRIIEKCFARFYLSDEMISEILNTIDLLNLNNNKKWLEISNNELKLERDIENLDEIKDLFKEKGFELVVKLKLDEDKIKIQKGTHTLLSITKQLSRKINYYYSYIVDDEKIELVNKYEALDWWYQKLSH